MQSKEQIPKKVEFKVYKISNYPGSNIKPTIKVQSILKRYNFYESTSRKKSKWQLKQCWIVEGKLGQKVKCRCSLLLASLLSASQTNYEKFKKTKEKLKQVKDKLRQIKEYLRKVKEK